VEIFAAGHILPNVGGKPMSWLENGDRLTIDGWFKTQHGQRAGFGGLSSLVTSPKS
jgi:fumarylacetoacetase